MMLRLSNGTQIVLPSEFDVKKRLALVNDIMAAYPSEFEYGCKMFETKFGQSQDTNRLVKIKLDILATYIIRADKQYTKSIMSRYKETARPKQEVAFSQFNESVADMKGWY